MEPSEPPAPGPSLLAPDGPAGAGATRPAVVAVLVTEGAHPGLEDTLESLVAQDLPTLSVLVLSLEGADDPTPRIAGVAPGAFVRSVDVADPVTAAAEVITGVEGAAYLCFVRPGVVLDASALRCLVDEAVRSNAGIAGPKVLDREHPDALVEVGPTVDRFGVAYTGIEPGELDQEQHDSVRDTFFVSSTVMLVRADLFAELGGFDPRTWPGAHDLDLCWRARLAGARVLVVPDARAFATPPTVPPPEAATAPPGALATNRLRVLLKAYSPTTLARVLPAAAVLHLAEAVAFLVARQPGRARGLAVGWWANLRGVGELRRARREVQALRHVPDADVRGLMVRGSARVRRYTTSRLRAGERLEEASLRTREAATVARGRLRRPEALAWAVLLLLVVFGSRDLLTGRVPEVGTLVRWPGVGSLFGAFGSAWRHTRLGAASPAPTAFGLLGTFGTVLVGDTALARTVLVVGALPLGAFGVYRLTRPLGRSALPSLAATVVYLANPVGRNAIALGTLGPLVLYALAPFLVAALLRAAAVPPSMTEAGRTRGSWRRPAGWGPLIGLTVLTALVAAAWPPALLLAPLAAVALLVAAPLVGGTRLALRALGAAGVAVAGALVLVFPWPLAFLHADAASVGFVPRRALDLGTVLAFRTGPSGAGWAPWGLLAAAALPLAVARGPRLAWAGRAWLLAASCFAVAWVPSRVAPSAPVPSPEGVLVPAALGLSLAVGLGVAAIVDDLRRVLFGWRQLVAVLAALGLVLPALGFLGDTFGGRWRMPARDWPQALGWMRADAADGGYRVLWLGAPQVLPLDARYAAGTGWGLTRAGGTDALGLWGPAATSGDRLVAEAVGLVAQSRTARLGHLLAPMGVRYVAVVDRPGPKASVRVPADRRVADGVEEQLDLALVQSEPGMVLYENEAWFATRAVVGGSTSGVVGPGIHDPSAVALRTDLAGATPVTGPLGSSDPAGPGTLLWSENHDARWHASVDGVPARHARAFGWADAYVLDRRGPVSLTFAGGPWRGLALLVEAAAWVLLGALAWRARRSRREAPA